MPRPPKKPKGELLRMPPLPPSAVVVLSLQSPVSDLWQRDAEKCLNSADWLEALAMVCPVFESRDAAQLAAVMRVAAELRKQAAESLLTAQTRFKAERTSTVKTGLDLVPPQTSRLLRHAQKAIEELAEASAPGEIDDAKSVETT